jgi:hypothetical protein
MVDNKLTILSIAENNWRVFYFRKFADFYGDGWRILAATWLHFQHKEIESPEMCAR